MFDGMHAEECQHPYLALGIQRKSNGAEVVREWCELCGWRSQEIARSRYSSDTLAALPLIEDLVTTDTTCGYRGCVNTAVENHHYAPQAIFGAEADNYPIGPLCVEHHNHWHNTITSGGSA